ncbi:2-amino-4-hydroxy-6-hydroxymethyldihydropteridine diphosphokinase [Bacteroidota bacterium]
MKSFKERFILLTGSNIGDRTWYLNNALILIEKNIGGVIKKSSVLSSEAWGFESEHKFLNQALLVESELTPLEVLAKIHEIENHLGRIREKEQWVSRKIDIDILCYENLLFQNNELTVPHIQLHQREFALEPLCELVPNWVHPHLGISYSQLLTSLKASVETTRLKVRC